jgi:NAD(P)H-hydrate repair Nnr-like enzyme with NAD(P)H-hydrate dehydratase domain
VLAGLIGGLIAQARGAMPAGIGPRVPDLYELARAGVEAHAAAGERWARERGASAGLDPRELCELIPVELEGMREVG